MSCFAASQEQIESEESQDPDRCVQILGQTKPFATEKRDCFKWNPSLKFLVSESRSPVPFADASEMVADESHFLQFVDLFFVCDHEKGPVLLVELVRAYLCEFRATKEVYCTDNKDCGA